MELQGRNWWAFGQDGIFDLGSLGPQQPLSAHVSLPLSQAGFTGCLCWSALCDRMVFSSPGYSLLLFSQRAVLSHLFANFHSFLLLPAWHLSASESPGSNSDG